MTYLNHNYSSSKMCLCIPYIIYACLCLILKIQLKYNKKLLLSVARSMILSCTSYVVTMITPI